MAHLVFTQLDQEGIPLDSMKAHARVHFDATLSWVGEQASAGSEAVRVHMSGPLGRAEFSVEARASRPDDQTRARNAEVLGRASGMSALAMRCPRVFVVESVVTESEGQLLEFCALLAAIGLGPILPPDGSTLLGVRSARALARR